MQRIIFLPSITFSACDENSTLKDGGIVCERWAQEHVNPTPERVILKKAQKTANQKRSVLMDTTKDLE
jgi:hypothetical protein